MSPSRTNISVHWPFWLILAVLVVVFPLYTWHQNTSGFLTDDGVYLLMADFFSPFFHGNPAVVQLLMDQERFPPAFPMLIGLLGGGSGNMHAAHLVTCGTFLASAVLFYAWARRCLGARDTAAACVIIYAVLPMTLVYVLELWSEYLYMTLVFAALLVMDTAKRSEEHRRELLLACSLLVGLSVLTRMIGVALFAAFAMFLYGNAVRRKYFYILLAAVLPICWEMIKLINHYGGGYIGDLHRYLSPGGMVKLFLHDMPHNGFVLLESWGRHFAAGPGSWWGIRMLAGVLLVLALIGGVRRAAARAPDAFYVLAYIAVVLVWPYPGHETRFLYPLVPMGLVYAFAGLSALVPAPRMHRLAWLRAGMTMTVLLMVFPNVVFVANRILAPVPSYIPEDYRHTRWWLEGDMTHAYYDAMEKSTVVRTIKRIGDHVSPIECVYSAHPVITMLYSQRLSIIVPRHASVDKLTSCKYLFVMNLESLYPPYYPLRRINLDKLTRLDSETDRLGRQQALLFRIRH